MAFHFIIHATASSSSVTVCDWGLSISHADRIGIHNEVLLYEYLSLNTRRQVQEDVSKMDSIDKGLPVIIWALRNSGIWLITGYDDGDQVSMFRTV